jgi:hypothetical protein
VLIGRVGILSIFGFLGAILMIFLGAISMFFRFLPLWSFFDAFMRANLDFFDA